MVEINRDPIPFWQLREHSVPIDISDFPDAELLHRKCADSFAEFGRQMTAELYGDPIPHLPPGRWQLFKNWLRDNRLTNAWLVLIGREDIDREYR